MRGSTFVRGLLLALAVLLLSGCGYNQIQTKDEAVGAAWSEVLNEYKRRADLIPNLVNTVKGYAAHEQGVLTAVTGRAPRSATSRSMPTIRRRWRSSRPRRASSPAR